MILKAKHHFIVYPFFKRYAVWKIKKCFHDVKIIGEYKQSDQAILLLSNHISWWDGFWAMYLNVKVFHKKFHFMMLEDQLRKHWFFNYTGGFSINKKHKSILETLAYTSELLSDSNNMILVYPQGEIQTMHNQTLIFEKGLERISMQPNKPIQIVFMANLVDYFSNPKPSIYMYIKTLNAQQIKPNELQSEYATFYQNCIQNQKTLNNNQ